MNMQTLDKHSVRFYSGLSYRIIGTEAYRIWYKLVYERQYRIDHYGVSQESSPHRSTAGLGHRGADHRRGGTGLHRQQTDDLPSDPERQTQSLSTQQRLSDQAGRSQGVVREFGSDAERPGRDESVAHRQKNSASSQVARPVETDAAMDKPWQKYTSSRRRQQRLWTAQASETPGLPSWAGGSGSGSVPSPSASRCILKPLTSVSGCLSVRPTGCSMGIGGTSTRTRKGYAGSGRWNIRSATLFTTTRLWLASKTSGGSRGWTSGTSWQASPGSRRSKALRPSRGTLA